MAQPGRDRAQLGPGTGLKRNQEQNSIWTRYGAQPGPGMGLRAGPGTGLSLDHEQGQPGPGTGLNLEKNQTHGPGTLGPRPDRDG